MEREGEVGKDEVEQVIDRVFAPFVSTGRVDMMLDLIRERLREAMEAHPGQEADCRVKITLAFKPKAEKIDFKCEIDS